MHKSRLGTIMIDCKTDDVDGAAGFWAAALGTNAHVQDDPAEYRYRSLDTPRDQPTMGVQQVDHPSRVHIDIETDDIEAEVTRLEKLGAKRIAFVRRWWVLEAPTGHRFCVVRPQRGDFDETANRWP